MQILDSRYTKWLYEYLQLSTVSFHIAKHIAKQKG